MPYLEKMMRKTILATVAVLAIGGGTAGVLIAQAQPAPSPQTADAPSPPQHPHWMGWMHRDRDGHGGPWAAMRRNFALVYRHEDRQLAPPDVQKIAEAFLLWNGNHTWKVANVKSVSDSTVGFDLTTASGDVIASFTMDTHTARVTRAG
jgi:hypothetical protein